MGVGDDDDAGGAMMVMMMIGLKVGQASSPVNSSPRSHEDTKI
jgi:hypothetical protein